MPTKTLAGIMMIEEGKLEVVCLVVRSDANKDQGTTDDGATPFHVAAQKVQLST